jgi:hypothetical protein
MEQVLQMQSATHSQAVLEASRRTTEANAQALQIQADAQSKALREVSESWHAALKAQTAEQRKALYDSTEAADSALRQVSDRLEAMLKANRKASQTGIEELTERLDALMLNLAEEIASCQEQVKESQKELTKDLQTRQQELTKDLQTRQEKLWNVLDESKRQFNAILDERVAEISSAAEGGRGFLAARIDETNERLESMAGSMKSDRLMDLEDQVSLVTLGLKKKADRDDLEESATEFAEKLKDATNAVKNEMTAKMKASEGTTITALEELRQTKVDVSMMNEHVARLPGSPQIGITETALEERLQDMTSKLTVAMSENGEIRRLKDGLATTTRMVTTLMNTLNGK